MNYIKCQKSIIELTESDLKGVLAEHLGVPEFQISIEHVIGGLQSRPQVALTRIVVDHSLKFKPPPRD